nr:hypothetical protein [Tanacetum cinerariifolium]
MDLGYKVYESDTIDAEINSLLDIKIQSKVPHIQSPFVLTVLVSVIFEPSILIPIPVTPLVAPVTTLLTPLFVSTITPVPHLTTAPILTSPIITDALTITTTVTESDALSAVQLRVAKLEKDVYEVKKLDHFAKSLATLRSQVSTVVEKYLGSKIGDDFQKKPTIDLEQESKKSASEIRKIKMEQAEKQKIQKYTIKSTNKASLKEYDQKCAFYQTMHENKSFNRNLANHALYHALIEALIEDENTMDKGVVDTVKNHKREHDDDVMKTLQLGQTREPVKELIAEVAIDDAVNIVGEEVVHNDDQPQDTSEPKTYKTPNQDWFKQPPRPPTPDLKRNKRQVVLHQPEQPWFNQMVFATKDPLTFNDLMATPIDFSKKHKLHLSQRPKQLGMILWILKTWWSTIKHAYEKDAEKGIKHKGERRKLCVTKLHGYGHLEEVVVKRADRQLYNFKEGDFVDLHLNDIEDMLLLVVQHKLFHLNDSDIVDFIMALRMFTRSLVIKRRVEDLQHGVESYQKKLNITAPQQTFLEIKFKKLYTPSYNPPGVIYVDLNKQKRVMRADELHKFLNSTLKKVRDELHYRILNFCLGYNEEMSRRKWTATDKRKSKLMVEFIDKQMRERRIIRNSRWTTN